MENPPEAVVVSEKELEQIKHEVNSFILQSKALAGAVKDETSKIEAEEYLVNLASEIKRREDFFRPMKQAADAAKAVILKSEHDVVDPLKEAKKILVQSCATYTALIEQKEREDQERLHKEAAKSLEDAALRTAEHLEASGQSDAAESILAHAAATPAPPVILRKESNAKGAIYRNVYKFRIVDLGALVKAAGARLELRMLLKPDESAIRRRIESLKGAAEIPGVHVWVEKDMTVRSQKSA